MNTITQEELDRLKGLLAAGEPGQWRLGGCSGRLIVKHGYGTIAEVEAVGSDFKDFDGNPVIADTDILAHAKLILELRNLAPALITAAEEGLKAEGEIKRLTFCRDNAVSMGKRASEEAETLRARVQELEVVATSLLDKVEYLEDAGPFGESYQSDKLVALIERAKSVLSNSIPQPPRYTLEEVTYAYTIGYQNGHEFTVESSFLPIVSGEYTTFWKDDVEELMNELRGTQAPQQKEEA
jgi:hypothetical protein